MRFVIFGLVFLSVMGAANYYIYSRFFRRLSSRLRRYAWVVPSLLMLGELFFVWDIATGLVPDSPLLYLTTSAFVGITFMLFVVTTFYDLSITASRRVPFDNDKRRTIKLLFDVTMLVAAFAYVGRAFAGGVSDPRLNRVTVSIPDFPQQGYTILQLSDMHVGRTIRRDFVQRIVERANALSPDMVVITGDLVDLPVSMIAEDLAPLAQLRSPTYFITGNHEYFHGVEAVVEHLQGMGITPLLNESRVIPAGRGGFNLVGINDLIGARIGQLPPDLDAAFANVVNDLPSVVLAHQPKTLLKLQEQPCDLMLSGHTHGGQIFPFGLLVMMDQPYLAGLHYHPEGRQIFVSRGTGYWGPPLRLLAQSEISLITINGESSVKTTATLS